MSKFVKFLAVLILLGGAIAATPDIASAQHRGGGGVGRSGGGGFHGGGHGGGFRGGGYRGGGGHYRGGGWGPGFGFGFGVPYGYYGGSYYDDQPNCGYVRIRVLRGGHWVLRRSWRCW
jgi:hypothetical protein